MITPREFLSAAEELPKIAERYFERGTVPTFVIAPCFVPV